METVYRCLAGIGVHKRMLAVVIRQDQDGQASYEERAFGTTRKEIEHLAACLQYKQVTEVVMESTAQYWRPVWYGLEAHFRLHLCHPLMTRAPRGRKRDFRDVRRLVDRLHSGDLEDSFVPGAGQRSWRWLSRARVDLKDKVGVVRSQVEGLLEQGPAAKNPQTLMRKFRRLIRDFQRLGVDVATLMPHSVQAQA